MGQSKNVAKRLKQHVQSGKITKESATNAKKTKVSGGKTQREIAEQKRLDELGGANTKKNKNEKVDNQRNPVSKKRKERLKKEGKWQD